MSDERELPAVREDAAATAPWRGDEHRLQVQAAGEAGLAVDEVAADLYTKGFSAGMTIDDPLDGAIVARGRTVLDRLELSRSLRPVLRYLGIAPELVALEVVDGRFALRVHKKATEGSKPVFEAGKVTLQIWIGFGLLGFAAGRFMPAFVSAILWGVGLMLGAWQLRRGLTSGRAMIAARLAIGLGMLAQAEQLVLPPEGDAAGRG
ncbi:MAG: hypothetical protein U0168_31580 [Nannocystaceae bacterium]